MTRPRPRSGSLALREPIAVEWDMGPAAERTMTEKYLILDFEGSGIGRDGFPVEVAWAAPEGPEVFEALICPERAWLVPGAWEARSARVHGIALVDAVDGGRRAADVAAALREAAAGRTLLSDMAALDQRYLDKLCGGDLRLADFWATVRRLGTGTRVARAVDEVDRQLPDRHRAGADVRRLAFLWRNIVD